MDYIKYLKQDAKYKIDKFVEKISIATKTNKGLVAVGCSHAGIFNTIVERTGINIYGVVGGPIY